MALAEEYLANPQNPFRNVPIAILTGFPPSADLTHRIELFGQAKGEVSLIRKASDITGFEDFVRQAIESKNHDIPLISFGAIVTVEREVPDGQLVKLVDPGYTGLIRALHRNPDIVYDIDPRTWEEIIAGAYEKEGFDDVILTPRSGDLGRDIIAIKRGFGSIKFIEQVKAYRRGHLVTAEEVRALLGVLHAEQDASKAIFSTTSTFAPRLISDRLIRPFLPHRLELVDKQMLLRRLLRSPETR